MGLRIRLATLGALLCCTFVSADLPLKANSTLEVTTNTVTWLSFDLSPDGQTFVLEVLGELYTMPREGGVATPLSTGLAFDSQPVYSPDGEHIAFVSDRSGSENIWIMQADGSSPWELSDTDKDSELMSPSWSPDGSHVIASVGDWKSRVYRTWAFHLAGGKGVRLTPRRVESRTERQNYVGAVYSNDGRYLYYAYKEGGFGYNQQLPLWQIRRLDLASNNAVALTAAVGSAFRPVLSPDGSKLVYGTRASTRTGLRMRDLQTGQDEWLAYPVQRDEQESRYTRDLLPKPVFSPDGKVLYFTVSGKLAGLNLESRKRFNVPLEIPLKLDRVERLEFPHRLGIGPVKAQLIRGIEPSPDGSKVAFSALAQIFVYDLATKEIVELTPPSMFVAQPTWSPNGRQIAFVDWQQDGGNVWRVRVRANAKPTRVSNERGFYFEPLWRRDGDSIVVLRASAHERSTRASDFGLGIASDLVQIDLAKGASSLVTHAPHFFDPHEGPESDRIYVYQWPGMFEEGASGLFSMRLDGTDRREHLEVTGPGIYSTKEGLPAHRIRMSPDGQHALIKQANQLFVMKLFGVNAAPVKTRVTNCSLPCERITNVGVDEFAWSGDGRRVIWSIGHTIYSRPLESIFSSKGGAGDDENKKNNDEKTLAESHQDVDHYLVEIYKPRTEPQKQVVLRNATVLSVRGDEPAPQQDTDVLVKGDRIEAIGSDLVVTDGTDVIDLNGKYLVPGYVDTHAHFPFMRGVVSGESWALLANLAYGVTTAIDVQPSTVDVIEYQNLVDAGRMVGPRTLSTGPGIFSDTTFKSKQDAIGVLRRYKEHYGVRNLKSYIPGNRKKRHWIIEAAYELGLNPTTEGALDMKLVLTHVLDGFTGLEHNLPIIGVYDDVVQLLAQSGVAYTPTLLVSYGGPFGETHFLTQENPRDDPKLARFTPPSEMDARFLRSRWFHPDEHVFQRHALQALRVVRAGGRVGVGSHGQLQGLGFHWELWALSAGGFTNFEALRAATRHGAEMLGLSEDLGSIEEGKLADFVVLNSNPYDDIRATNDIEFVILNGVVRNAENLAQIWPEAGPPHVPTLEAPPLAN